jgi:hypothetical protein
MRPVGKGSPDGRPRPRPPARRLRDAGRLPGCARGPVPGPLPLLAAATALQGILFFVVLPLGGLASGAYAVRRGPFSGVGLFVAGSYLAVLGLTLGFGLVSAPAALSVVGLVLAALAVVAVLASLRAMWTCFRIEPG